MPLTPGRPHFPSLLRHETEGPLRKRADVVCRRCVRRVQAGSRTLQDCAMSIRTDHRTIERSIDRKERSIRIGVG